MADETDLIKLYSKRILALAANMPDTGRLDNPDGTARKRSPLCGSAVTVDLNVADGRIIDYGQDVKACALGQASASVIAANAIGRNRAEIETARQALLDMLKSGAPAPKAPFDGLEALLPARDYKNRHASIMLTFDAILAAFDSAEAHATV